MAGCGPVSEILPTISVPKFLSEGGRFLKWDDQDPNCIVYLVYVDPKGYVLYWKPESGYKDPEVLTLTTLRDVRYGPSAKVPKSLDVRARDAIKLFSSIDSADAITPTSIQNRTVTIVYGPNMVDLTFINFIAPNEAQAREWGESLFICTNNLLEITAAPLKSLEAFYTQIYVQQNQDGDIPAKLLVKYLVTSKDDKKRAYDTLQSVGLASGKKDTIKAADFTFQNFIAFYNRLVTRHDIDAVFAELGARMKPYLTKDQLVKFLNERQRDPRLNEILFPYYNAERAQEIIYTYEANEGFADKGYISIDGLTKFLMSKDNPILLPTKLQIHQDLTFPMSHYFINSSHNTYLTGHQLTGKSSVEIYRQVLLAGCRCVELDCWDGKSDEQEPVITHGMTLCTEVPFKDVLEAINESAFKTSEYPVILSFENHCSAKQQLKMAAYCIQIFGDQLLDKNLDDYPLEEGVPLPSPRLLKRKILIKNKKRAIKEIKRSPSGAELYGASDSFSASLPTDSTLLEDLPEEVEGEEELELEGEEDVKEAIVKTEEDEQLPETEAQQELSNLVNYFQPVHFMGFERAEKVRKCYQMSSLTENSALNYLRESPMEFVNYNKFQPSRIYPKGSRVSSDNYMPQLFWNAGCQFVALNFQTLDLPMMLNLGKFEMNGRCGYLLKPEHMRRTDLTFDPFVEAPVDGIIAGDVSIRIISAQCLSERRVSTYVEVEMYGLPVDTVRRKYKTKVVQNNGLNPVYDEDPYHFKVILPQLAEMRIAVFEDNGKMIGHRVLPLDGLSPGYRHIRLRNEAYQPLALPTLFVDIVTKDNVPEEYSDFADALANPMKYLSEKEKEEKRTMQMQSLMGDEEDTIDSSAARTGTRKDSSKISASKSTSNSEKSPEKTKETEVNAANGKKQNDSRNVQNLNKPVAPPTKVQQNHEVLDTKPPDMDALMEHKMFIKLKQKHDNEMQGVVQKHAKNRCLINKDLEAEAKQLRCQVEKERSMVKKRNSKLLKKSEKEESFTDLYNGCTNEINELTKKHEQEMELLMGNQQVKVKEQFKLYYQEQLNVAKSHVESKNIELKQILELIEDKERKNLSDYHSRKIGEVKKEQDKKFRELVKNLSRKVKDKAELLREKKTLNKKHIENSVRLIQDMNEKHEKEEELLSKRYEEIRLILESKPEKDIEELDEIFKGRVLALETEDLQKLIPVLLPPSISAMRH